MAEMQHEGVDTAALLRAEGAPSPFTYIIVDRQGEPYFRGGRVRRWQAEGTAWCAQMCGICSDTSPAQAPPFIPPHPPTTPQAARAPASTHPASQCGPRS